MKKQLIIILVGVLIVSIFVSCSANSSRENISTTVVTDDNSKVSTTGKNQGVYAEIATKLDDQAVTNKNGTYITNRYTTILTIKDDTTNPSSTKMQAEEKSSSSTTKYNDNTQADNTVNFESDKPTEEMEPTITTTETTTQKVLQPATDKDNWITKWY